VTPIDDRQEPAMIAHAEAHEREVDWRKAAEAHPGPCTLRDEIVADLRAEADVWNRKLMVAGVSDELRRHYRKTLEELRRLANRYETWQAP
jgi:hypothetical protein